MKSLYSFFSSVNSASNVKLSESLSTNPTESLLKKFILRTAGLVALFLFLGGSVWGQCVSTFTTQLPATTQNPGTSFTTNTGKYFAINVVSGTVYKITSSLGGSAFNIRMGTYNGTIIWTGISGSFFTAPSTGVAYVHHSTQACATTTNTTNRTINFVAQASCNTSFSTSWSENFDGLTATFATGADVNAPCGWTKTHGDWGVSNAATSSYNDPRSGTYYLTNLYTATNEGMFTRGFQLSAGSTYDFSFYFVGDALTGWTGDVIYNTAQVVSTSTVLGSSFISSATVSSTSYQQVTRTFTPTTSGVYYFGIRINANGTPWYLGFDDFSLTQSVACTGTPNAGTATISAASGCAGASFNLSATGLTNGIGISYQWQSSPDNANWTNISGATSSSYTTSTISTKYYRLVTTCSSSSSSNNSNSVSYTPSISALPYSEPFATTTTPTCWDITGWTIGSTRGVTGNPGNNIYKNLYSSATTGQFSSGVIGPITSGLSLNLDYKHSNFASPYGAPGAGTGNFKVQISSDGGVTYSDLATVSNDGLTDWRNLSYSLSSYVGMNVKLRILATWVSGDWDYAFDNIQILGACSGTPTVGETYTWSPAVVSGYNADIIANGVGSASASATQADVAGYGFVSADFKATTASAAPTYALPVSGIVNSAANAGVKYQLASSNLNNALRLVSGSTSGTVTLSSPTSARRIGLLVTSGSGTSTFSAQVNFSDGTNETFSNIAVADWYGSGYAIAGIGRVVLSSNVLEGSATQPGLYDALITLSASNYSKTISSILITKTDAIVSSLIVMGVSLYTSSTSQVVCNGQSRVLSIPAALTGVTGLTYQWQSSGDNSTWANIASATSTTYTTPALTTAGNTYYRCGVTCSGNTGYSSSILLTVNGTASVSAGTLCSGGTAEATALPATNSTYFWSSSLGTNQTATISSAGTYTVNVNNNGCISANNVTLTSVPLNTVGSASSTPTICVNSALTAITHSTTGATGIGAATGLPSGVTAAWASNTITISGTATEVGTFNYSIPLTGGCGTVNATGTITVSGVSCASSLSPSDNATNQSANGIVLSWGNVTCATGYDVYVNDVLVSENQAELAYSTGTLSPLSSYTWKVVPRNGSVFASGCSTLNFTTSASCTPPTFTVESTNVSCFGQSTGSITISASGGQSPLSYSIDGGNTYSSSEVFTSLPAGTYSVVVKGSDDCLAAAQAVTISQPAAVLAVTASGGGSGCEGSTLSLTSSVSGGTSPYTYSWSNAGGLNSSSAANPTATIGSFTSHTLTVTDANGCTSSSSVTITNNSPAAPTVVTPDAICQGQSANLNATSAGNSINWYTTSSGGTAVASLVTSGANYSVSPLTTTTYYAEAVVASPGSQSFSYTGSIVNWTVPEGVTSINVDASGAQGGSQPEAAINYGGRGARIVSNNISVTPGQILKILVGQAGTNGSSDDGCGGGGGTYLTTSSNTPLVVAGGGGGDGADQQGINASLTTTSTANGDASRAGSTGPNGGLANDGSGGGGLSGNGANGTTTTSGGFAFINGGAGGVGLRNGGFGGGGAGGTSTEGAGGGGGYAGGPGGSSGTDAGGGGSSYSIVTPATATATQTGNGSLLITYTAVGCASARTPVTVTVNEAPTATAGAALSAICQGQTSAAMGGSIGGTATSGTWTGGAGTWTNANDPANATYTAGASESGTITLTLTPNGGSCPSVVATKTIVVNANPNFTVTPSSATICSGSSQALSIGSGLNIPNYNFASSTGTYTAIAGGTTSTATGDDAAESAISIGFNFYYRGLQYNQFGVSTNGIIQLGSSTTNAWTNALASTTDIIAPFWDDNNSSSGSIKYTTTGTSPNRVLTVEWLNVAIGGSGATGTSTNNFQVKLFETTNVIQMLYGAGMSSANSLSGSIGISGAAGSYLSVTPGSTPTVSSSAENSGISSVANLGSGTIYTFSPQYSVAWTPTSSLYSDVAALTAYNSGSLSAVYAKPTITTTYTATATSAAGCTSSSSATVTVNQPSVAPTALSASTATICNGGSTTLTQTGGSLGTGAVWQWYSDANFTTTVGATQTSADASLSVSPTTTSTYYLRAINGTSPCAASVPATTPSTVSVTVTVSQPSVAPTSISGTTTICNGASTALTAVGATLGTGATYEWGTGSTVGSSPIAGTGSSITVSPTATTSYWVRVTGTTSPCATTTDGVITSVTVNALPTAVTVSGGGAICAGTSATLTADNGGSGTIYWQNTTSGGTSTATASASQSVSAAGTYYFRPQSAEGCWGTEGSATVTVTSLPSTPVVTVVDNCDGTSTLSTTAAGTLLWSTTETTSPITVSTAGTYTVTQTANGCTSAAGSGVAAPKSTPATPSITVTNSCGQSTLSFTPATNATILWSNNATTSSTTTTNTETLTVVQTVNGCPSAAGSGSAVPLVIPSAPTATASQNFCVTDNATVASLAYTSVAGNTYTWYDAATAGNIVATSTQLPIGTSTYYLSTTGSNGCTSTTRTAISATEAAQVLATVEISGTTTCPGGEITFTATPSNGGNSPTYQWYNGGVPILNATGNTYIATGLAEGAVITVKMIPSGSCVTVCPN